MCVSRMLPFRPFFRLARALLFFFFSASDRAFGAALVAFFVTSFLFFFLPSFEVVRCRFCVWFVKLEVVVH